MVADVCAVDWHAAGLTIGEVAARGRVAPSALRFYEAQGLISSVRTAGNQRRYDGDVLCRVMMIRACQRVGLTIAEIRAALAELPDSHIPGTDDWERLAARLRSELHDRIGQLNALLDELSGRSVTARSARSRAR
jgi:MerR family transcriptional regulator, redox-sensitive transcriptional activator SoxR